MMPQNSVRSAVYRSFLTCDDPKGVECGAIRKQNKNTSSSRRTEQKMKTEKGKAEIERPKRLNEDSNLVHNSSSQQLVRVSRGVQKLNNILESWSKGIIFEGQSKDVAKDLLRGALDLEESLAMLGRIQETSNANFKEKATTNEVRIQRSISDRIEARNSCKGFEKPRISADGSSGDCYEELRKVIKESFVRHNPLIDSTEKPALVHRSNKASSSGIGSTSSSQSSTANGNDSGSTKSSFSWETPPRSNAKGGPGLIAKLMGVKEFPPEPTERANFETGRTEQKKKKALEIAKFKDCSPPSPDAHWQDSWRQEERLTDNDSPIVLIKPVNNPQPERGSKGKTSGLRNPRAHMEIHPRKIDQRNEARTSIPVFKKRKARLISNKPDHDLKQNVGIAREKEAEITQTAPRNARPSGASTSKKTDKAGKPPKPTNVSIKIRERDEQKAKKMPAKLNKSDSKSDSGKLKVSGEKGSYLNSKSQSEQTGNRRKKEKTVHKLISTTTEKRLRKDGKKRKDPSGENKSVSSEASSDSAKQLTVMEKTSELEIEEKFNSRESYGFDSTSQNSDDKKDVETSADSEISNYATTLKSFLLKSSDFLTFVEEVLHLDTNTATTSASCSKEGGYSFNISDQGLSLDCTKELIRCRSFHEDLRKPLSLDQLLVEICRAFEALMRYNALFTEETCITDSVNAMLEKDLSVGGGHRIGGGIWEPGWRTNGSFVDENVAMDLERFIFTGLIEEVFS